MSTYKFDLSNHRYVQLLTDVKRFNKIADRMDTPHISVEITETYKAFDPLAKVVDADLTWTFPQIDYYKGTVNNFDVSFGDFSFIGCLVHRARTVDPATGEIVRSIQVRPFPDQTVPKQFYGVDPVCEHCELKRDRVVTYIVKNNATGEYQQIGSTCFNVYLGIDASDIIRLLRIITRISDTEGYEEKTRKTKKQKPLFNTKDILKLTNSVIRLYGYHSRNKSGDFIPTADIVRQICLEPTSNESKTWVKKIKENRNDYLDESVALAVQKWALTDFQSNNYFHAIQRIVKNEIVSEYELGTLCSAIDAHTQKVKEKIERKKLYSNEYFGNVGENYSKSLKCVDVRNVTGYNETQSKLIKLIDDDKNLFVWFHVSGFDIKIGQIKKFKFKIKEHSDFNGEKQTKIFYVKELQEHDDKYAECPEYKENSELDTVV